MERLCDFALAREERLSNRNQNRELTARLQDRKTLQHSGREGKKRIDFGPQEVDQLRLHVVEEVGDAEDGEFTADINIREIIMDIGLVHLFHYEYSVSPSQKFRSDLLCGCGGGAC